MDALIVLVGIVWFASSLFAFWVGRVWERLAAPTAKRIDDQPSCRRLPAPRFPDGCTIRIFDPERVS